SAPGAAAHAEREIEPVVEAAAVAERVRLVDQHPHDIRTLGQRACAAHILGVQADRMAAALMREDLVGARDRGIEILGTIDGKHQREFLAGERNSSTMKNFFDSAAAGRPQLRASTSASRAINVRLSLPSGQSAAWIFAFSAPLAR